MTSEINKQIAELLLKQTYAERMWLADKYHSWLQGFYETVGEFPRVQDIADAFQDIADAFQDFGENFSEFEE